MGKWFEIIHAEKEGEEQRERTPFSQLSEVQIGSMLNKCFFSFSYVSNIIIIK